MDKYNLEIETNMLKKSGTSLRFERFYALQAVLFLIKQLHLKIIAINGFATFIIHSLFCASVLHMEFVL